MSGEMRPLCFWGWNGDMRPEEVTAQLRDFRARGMGGVLIHSRAGLRIPYMGEEWFSAFGTAVEECGRLGLEVWIYDEDGWPSGFAGGKVLQGHPEFSQASLLCSSECPARPDEVVAVYDPETLALLWKEGSEAPLPAGNHLYIYRDFNPVYIDVLDTEAVSAFIGCTHEEYRRRFGRYFGNVIKGIFTDEPHISPRGVPWTRRIVSAYASRTGEDFYRDLPYLFRKAGGYRERRYRYWKFVAELFEDAYAKPYSAWCEAHNLIFTGHFTSEEGLSSQTLSNGAVMPLYRHMGMIGVDALGNRLIPANVFKQAESVAWQIGNRRVLCETYACTGYDATFSDLLYIWGNQAAMGVNVPCLSISMFSLAGKRKRDYPQYFSYQMPWWEKFGVLSDGFRQIDETLSRGERPEGILVVHTLHGVWCEIGYQGNDLESKGLSGEFRLLTEALNDLQLDFDYGDEGILADCGRVEGNKLAVGARSYTSVVLPPTPNLEASTLRLLKEFAGAGGKVLVLSRYPTMLSGRETGGSLIDFAHEALALRTDLLRKYFAYIETPRDFELLDGATYQTAAGFQVTSRRCGEELVLFFVNKARGEGREVILRVRGRKKLTLSALLREPEPLPAAYDSCGGYTYAHMRFDPQQVCFVRAEEGEPLEEFPEPVREERLLPAKIRRTDNALVLDRCRYRINGGAYSAFDYTIRQTKAFYDSVVNNGRGSELEVEYLFTAEALPERLELTCEIFDGSVTVNGAPALPRGWRTDRDFTCFDVTALVKVGENSIVLRKSIPPFGLTYDLDSVFQTVTNVFVYPYDIENVCLWGDFGTYPEEGPFPSDNCIRTGGELRMGRPLEPDAEDLTARGMYNFCGCAEIEAEYVRPEPEGRYLFCYDRSEFAAGELTVNGTFAGELGIPPFSLDVTRYLTEGVNRIGIKLYSGARNLFGPFHHVRGRHPKVGPSVFAGVFEFEDVVPFPELKDKGSTWTDRYAFHPFGIKNIRMKQLSK